MNGANDQMLVRLALWLSRTDCYPRWIVILFSCTNVLLFVAAILDLAS